MALWAARGSALLLLLLLLLLKSRSRERLFLPHNGFKECETVVFHLIQTLMLILLLLLLLLTILPTLLIKTRMQDNVTTSKMLRVSRNRMLFPTRFRLRLILSPLVAMEVMRLWQRWLTMMLLLLLPPITMPPVST